MHRRTRMYLPVLPFHIIQRGNNREACFVESENYQFYLKLWKEYSKKYDANIHTIEKANNYCQPVGDDQFKMQTGNIYGIKPGYDECVRQPKTTEELVII